MRVQHFLLTNNNFWRKINYKIIGMEMVLPLMTTDNPTDYLIKLRKTTERQGAVDTAVSYWQIPVIASARRPAILWFDRGFTRSLQAKSG
jgi:hypothetical protein